MAKVNIFQTSEVLNLLKFFSESCVKTYKNTSFADFEIDTLKKIQ